MSDFYQKGWRANHDSGEIAWKDNWTTGSNFQQIKGSGTGKSSALDEQFSGLTKSDSDVDDFGSGWKTLQNTPGMGATEDFKKLAKEWQAAGYDVRVQDLEGAEGTTTADIAVRKGQATPDEGPKEPTKFSNVANKALAYTEAY